MVMHRERESHLHFPQVDLAVAEETAKRLERDRWGSRLNMSRMRMQSSRTIHSSESRTDMGSAAANEDVNEE
jgi:hypothetical protein